MTDKPKRPRGRPPGPSKFNESLMAKLGDEMNARPTTPLAVAIRKVRGDEPCDDSFIRLVRRHWNDNKDALIAEAKERAKERARARRAPLAGVAQGVRAGAYGRNDALESMKHLSVPAMRELEEFSAAVRAVTAALPATSGFADQLIAAKAAGAEIGGLTDITKRTEDYLITKAREEAERQTLGSAAYDLIAREQERMRALDPLSGTPYDPRTATGKVFWQAQREIELMKRLRGY